VISNLNIEDRKIRYRDEWFSKPHLFFSDSGYWCCRSVRSDEWVVVGLGCSPTAAFNDMKRTIISAYKYVADSVIFA
jgi:hypothetical protein